MADTIPEAAEQCKRGEVDDDGCCFGCGTKNAIGMHLDFTEVDDGVRAIFTAGPQYQGYAGLLHGGLAATVIDEAIAWAVSKRYGLGVTAEFYMRHRHPIPVGEALVISARIVRRRLTMVEAEGCIADREGKTLAEGRAKFMLVKQASGVVK